MSKKCGKCEKKIIGKQKYNVCLGNCNNVFHLDCAETIPEEDKFDQLLELLISMNKEISLMRGEISSLKIDNDNLKSIISTNLNINQQNQQNPTHTQAQPQIAKAKKTTPSPATPNRSTITTGTIESSGSLNVVNFNNPQEFTEVVSKKKRRQMTICKGNATAALQPAPKRIPKRSIFITRLAQETSVQDLDEYLKTVLQVTAESTRLKTKYNTYSSFHISLNEVDLEKTLNPDAWPEGILISPFLGKLKKDQKYQSFNQLTTESKKEEHISSDSKNGSTPEIRNNT